MAGRTYLARVLGGATGVADVAGNRLAADVTWTFTTATGTGTTSYLSDLAYTVTANGWGPAEKDRSNGEQAAGDGQPITLNGTVYAKGLGVHAVSDVRYTMSNCTAFTASVGVDDEVVSTRGSIVFQVYLDDVLAYDSGTMTGATATRRSASTPPARPPCAWSSPPAPAVDYGHGDWADAKLTCGERRPGRHDAAHGDLVHPGQRRHRPADRDRPDRRVLRGDRPGHADHHDLQPDRPDDRRRGGRQRRLRRRQPAGDLHADRRPRRRPDVSRARPRRRDRVSPTSPATASSSDVTWTFTTAAAPDTTPPTVTGVHAGQRRDRPVDRTAPTATFSEAINAATLTTTTFSLTDQTTRPRSPASVSYNSATRIARRSPRAPPWSPAGPILPASSAARPASPTSPATASPRT